jgi:RES domain-containing protein
MLYRCFAWNEAARPPDSDGALWFPRSFQGEGRHDNPDLYGCLYLADRPLSCLVEQLARFRGQRLSPALLRRRGLPLALAELALDAAAALIDLDDPAALRRERLRPSMVATRDRTVTQPQARALYLRHRGIVGLRWWSTFEALWANVTLFDSAHKLLRLVSVRALTVDDPAVAEAADFFALRTIRPSP